MGVFDSGTLNSTATSSPPGYVTQAAQDLINRAQTQSNVPYQQYTGQRIQGFNPTQQQAFGQIQDASTAQNPYLAQAGQYLQQGAGGIGNLYQAQQFTPTPVTPQGIQAAQQGYSNQINPGQVSTQGWDNNQANAYMNPFQNQVAQSINSEFDRQENLANQGINAQAVRAGAFGGDRQAVANAESNRNLDQLRFNQLGQLGLQGYQNAEQQFNQDQARNLQGQTTNLNANLQAQTQNQGMQTQIGANNAVLQQQANQQNATNALQGGEFNAGQNLSAQQLANQSKLSAAGLTEGDLGRQLQAGQQASALGTQAQGLGLQGANALLQSGGMQQKQDQQGLNLAYQDYLAQRNYPYAQLGFMSNILSGTPNANTATTSQTSTQPLLQPLGSLGLTGVSLLGATGAFNSNGWLTNLFNSGGSGSQLYNSSLGALGDASNVGYATDIPDYLPTP